MIYSESDLIVPALLLLSQQEEGLSTSELIDKLHAELDIEEFDLASPPSRTDTRLSQKIRNLLSSHRTLSNKGLADYSDERDGLHTLTKLGREYLANHGEDFNFILKNGFDEQERDEVIKKDFKNLVVEEGFISFVEVKKRKRSRILVEMAKEHYTVNNKIYCHACNFNFEDFYGPDGKKFIEIHHLKPIFAYDGTESLSLEDALGHVRPVCSNCHRIIHRNNKNMLAVEHIRMLVQKYGLFSIGISA